MLANINYHIWFKVCKPIKSRYKISTNVTMVLNGAYILQQVNNKPFTRYKLLKYCTYYNASKIGSYITVLVEHGFFDKSTDKNNNIVYSLSSLGLSVIKELTESYEIELRKFIDLYNIVL